MDFDLYTMPELEAMMEDARLNMEALRAHAKVSNDNKPAFLKAQAIYEEIRNAVLSRSGSSLSDVS